MGTLRPYRKQKLLIPSYYFHLRRGISHQECREAIAGVARAIQTSVENVAAYLQGSHNFVSGASYKSDTAPTLPPQQDFQDAVRDDRALTDEKKRRWLEVASRSRNSQ